MQIVELSCMVASEQCFVILLTENVDVFPQQFLKEKQKQKSLKK